MTQAAADARAAEQAAQLRRRIDQAEAKMKGLTARRFTIEVTVNL